MLNTTSIYNVNVRYLAHALLHECSISSTCATLSGRRRNFFKPMKKMHY